VRYDWPGNVRELQSVIERAVILSTGTVLNVSSADLKSKSSKEVSVKRTRSDAPDRDQILEALRSTGGQVGGPNGAAARLGMKRTTFIAHMKRLGINPRTVISHF
jgi:formate hydrogenlyase transcriptional activator